MPELKEADIKITKPPFKFEEQRNSVFYHDVRIYIFGADVTPWLTSAITLSRADRNGINTLSFELSNVNRAFEITEENIGVVSTQGLQNIELDDQNNTRVATTSTGRTKPVRQFRMTDPYAADGMYSELAKATIFKNKSDSPTNFKHAIQSFGPVVSDKTSGARITDRDITNNADQTTSVATSRYPMNLGSLVFHKYDPVRFFVKNPLSTSKDEWTCEFTGYLDTKPFSQDYVNGQSTIRITCQDIRVLLQNMRINTNPATQTGNENLLFFGNAPKGTVKDTADAGLFNDFIVGGNGKNRLGHSLFGKSFVQSMKFLLLGTIRNNAYTGGVGKLTEGITLRYHPTSDRRKQVLEKWNNIIQFGSFPIPTKDDAAPRRPEGATTFPDGSFGPVNRLTDDFPQAAAGNSLGKSRETFLTEAQMISLGQQTLDGGRGAPDVARVHFLVPYDGGPLTNLVEGNIVDARVTARVEWASRLELITKLCKDIDYQFYVTGMGDIVFEFPMYDFLPTEFNKDYESIYTFTDHIQADSINDEGGTPISGLEVTSRTLRSEIKDPANAGAIEIGTSIELRRTIFSNVLASRIGVHVETHSIPGISRLPPFGNNEGKEAQIRLAQYGLIEFNKRLSNYNKFDLNATYRPFMGLNRPIYHTRKARMAITENVTYTWRIRQDVTLEMSMNYTRKLENNRFRFITGGERQPISYNAIFDTAVKSGVKGTGVNVTQEEEGKEADAAATTKGNTAADQTKRGQESTDKEPDFEAPLNTNIFPSDGESQNP